MPFRRTDEPELDALTRALAVQVAAERARRGLTQVELASLCGTTQSAVARLESGARPPRPGARGGRPRGAWTRCCGSRTHSIASWTCGCARARAWRIND